MRDAAAVLGERPSDVGGAPQQRRRRVPLSVLRDVTVRSDALLALRPETERRPADFEGRRNDFRYSAAGVSTLGITAASCIGQLPCCVIRAAYGVADFRYSADE